MRQGIEAGWSLPTLPPVEVLRPASLAELLHSAASGGRPFAGGTDLLVGAAQEGRELPRLVWTGSVPGLADLKDGGHELRVGAAATLGRVSKAVRNRAPALAEAAAVVGSVQIRNVATLAGNMCNASPAADTVPPLLVHDATVEIHHASSGARSVPARTFFEGPGLTALSEGEVVVAVSLRPLAPGEGSAYARFTVRKSMDLAFVGVAALVAVEEDGSRIRSAKIALGAVAPTAVLAEEAAAGLVGTKPDEDRLRTAGRAAAAACRPITDVRASAEFRLRLVEVMTGDVVLHAWRRARGEPA